jgi:hypothetical protein
MTCLRMPAHLALVFAVLFCSSAAGAQAPAAPRINAVASADGEAVTLGHVVTVTLCNLKDAKALDPTKLGLLLAGFRVAERPSTTLVKSGECDLVGGKGVPIEMRFRVEYTHAKRKDWLTVFDARDGDLKAPIGLADESGKPIAIEPAPDAGAVTLRRMLQWELWLFVAVAVALVGGLVAAACLTNLLRDGGDDLDGQWRRYLDGKFALWSAKNFDPGAEREAFKQAVVALGIEPTVADTHLNAIAPPAAGKTSAQVFGETVVPLAAGIERPYSLARLQMALWTVVIIAGLFLVYLITATIFQIPGSVLVLMGVSGATYLGARVLDARNAAAAAPVTAAYPPGRSRGLWIDIVSDERGVALHRAQMLLWTLVMVGLFLAELFRRLVFVEFDDTMLGLLGISNGAYLALKGLEK